jgi:lysophospholipase L1-like esterase
MRRTLLLGLPLAAAAVAAALFIWGFVLGVSGSAGTVVSAGSQPLPQIEPPRDVRIVILGDSLARGTGDASGLGIGSNLSTMLRNRKVKVDRMVNLAVNGARTGDLLSQLESRNVQILIRESSVVVLSIGGNDLFGLASERPGERPADIVPELERVEERVATVVEKIRGANPNARIFLVGLYNPFALAADGARVSSAVALWNARIIERFRGDANFTLVQTSDIFSHRDRLSNDRFHPGDEGYRIIAQRISDSL